MRGAIILMLVLIAGVGHAKCGASFEASTPLLNTALHDLGGFAYVHGALQKIVTANPGSEFCTSGLILSKDIYQNGQYYIQADVRSKMDRSVLYRMRFLFQDASTQAFQNMNQQPWTVVDSGAADQIVKAVVEDITLAPLKTPARTDVIAMAQASQTFRFAPAADGTIMAIPLENVSGLAKAHLVSWLTKSEGPEFASYQLAKGVVVGVNAEGQAMVAEGIWIYSSLTTPLQKSLQAQIPKLGNDLVMELLKAASASGEAFLNFFSAQLLQGRL